SRAEEKINFCTGVDFAKPEGIGCGLLRCIKDGFRWSADAGWKGCCLCIKIAESS
ncbi:hypothetical protein A2U01_0114063, partial [Trifolium medium]|nr:hypothetical protein [Trifolium medium]